MKNPPSSASVSRRNFLSLMAAAGAALPLASVTGAQTSGKGKAKEKAAAAASAPTAGARTLHVFSKPLQWMSYDDAAALIAEAGYRGVDFSVRPGGHVLPEKVQDDLPRAVAAAKKVGLKVEMITTAITSTKSPHAEAIVRTAAKLGVKVYRYGYLDYDLKLGVWESLQKHKVAMKELGSLNQSAGIHGAMQNHSGGRVGAPVWDLYELMRDLDSRWSGVQYDIRHAVVEGGQSWPLALRLLAPWIRCTDLKDFKWEQTPGKGTIENVPIGEGIVPFDAYFKVIRELNVGGPISVHLEYPPFERAPQIPVEQKRPLFLAGMKKDYAALTAHLTKHQLT